MVLLPVREDGAGYVRNGLRPGPQLAWQAEKLGRGECKLGSREHGGSNTNETKFLGLGMAGVGRSHGLVRAGV